MRIHHKLITAAILTAGATLVATPTSVRAQAAAQTKGQADEKFPTIADAHAALDRNDYGEAIQLSQRIMNRYDQELTEAEQYELLMIRGNALSARGIWDHARTAYERAAEIAPDQESRVSAMASAALLRRARGGTLDLAEGKTLDLRDFRRHSEAAAPAFELMLADLQPRVERAARATELRPIIELVPQLADLYSLEVAATGKSERTDPLFQELGTRARELMVEEIKLTGREIQQMRQVAGNLVTTSGFINPAGLSTTQQRTVREDVEYLQEIKRSARRGQQIAEAIGVSGQEWQPIILKADELVDVGLSLLDRRDIEAETAAEVQDEGRGTGGRLAP